MRIELNCKSPGPRAADGLGAQCSNGFSLAQQSNRVPYSPFAPTGDDTIGNSHGCDAGDVGSADSKGAGAYPHARLGNQQSHQPDVGGHLPDRARFTVSGPASIRESQVGDLVLAADSE